MESSGGHKPVAVEGYGDTLEKAFAAAWENAKKEFHGVHKFEVLRIVVRGENPISGYGVLLGPTGP